MRVSLWTAVGFALAMSGCFFRTAPSSEPATNGDAMADDGGGDAFSGDSDAGDTAGDSSPGDSGSDSDGGDEESCDVSIDCPEVACKEVSDCTWNAGFAQCNYAFSPNDSACDLDGSPTGSLDGICRSGICVTIAPDPCTENNECGTDLSCIGSYCVSRSDAEGVCDVFSIDEGDSEDCAGDLLCDPDDLVCRAADGASCSVNNDCVGSCIGGQCDAMAGFYGTCDAADDDDCAGTLLCVDEICLLADGDGCIDSDDCAHACFDGTCAAFAADGEACSEDGQCQGGICNHDVCGNDAAAVFIIDLEGHYGSNAATLTELEFYDGGTLLSAFTTDTDVFDSVRSGAPAYWLNSIWGRANLLDGDANYTNTATGETAATLFYVTAATGDVPDVWSRFAVFLPDSGAVTKIRMALGSPHVRIPHAVRVYRALVYDFDNQLVARSDTDLTLLWEILPENSAAWEVVRWEEIDL